MCSHVNELARAFAALARENVPAMLARARRRARRGRRGKALCALASSIASGIGAGAARIISRTGRLIFFRGTIMAAMTWGQSGRFCLTMLWLLSWASTPGLGQLVPEEVVFESGGLQLHGFLWKPVGNGPFPAVLWNHGSEKLPGAQPTLASFYTAHSYIFFVPHRRGQGRSPGVYIQDQVAQARPTERAKRMIELQDEEVNDVVAALTFLKSQPLVDAGRIAISGCSYGGIQTLLAGERDLGVRALLPFAPGAMAWDRNPLLSNRLKRAVDHATAPILLLQAENDYSLGPIHALTQEANKKHRDFQSKIYPAYGRTNRDGHWGFCSSGADVWGNDVLDFLNRQTGKRE